ncbi:MAG: hypothetical protein ACOY16_01580 [Chloroflexota bacterium]
MEHVVYLDTQAEEMENLLAGRKTMIIRGAAGRKLPYGRVNPGDILYFLNNDGKGLVQARAKVSQVLNSELLTPEASQKLLADHQDALQLTKKQQQRWSGKRYLVLITVETIQQLAPFQIDRSGYGNMDDWLPVGDINSVRI